MGLDTADADRDLIARIDAGASIEQASEMTGDYERQLIELLLVQADSALAAAYGYAPYVINAPTREGKLAVANLVRDEMRHAQSTYRLIEDLGVDVDEHIRGHDYTRRIASPTDLATLPSRGDRRAHMLHRAIPTWDDFLVASYLLEQAAVVMQDDARHASYGPWARLARGASREERLHCTQALARVSERAGNPIHVDALQSALDEWLPLALAGFGSPGSPRAEAWRRYGLRRSTGEDLRRRFHDAVVRACDLWALRVPAWDPPWEGLDAHAADQVAQDYEHAGA